MPEHVNALPLKRPSVWLRLQPIVRPITEWLWLARYPIGAWLIARLSLTVLAAWGATSLVMALEIPAGNYFPPRLFGWAELLVDVWQRWDSAWYLKIVAEGYRPERIVLADGSSIVNATAVFFPLYPATIWLVSHLLPVTPSVAGIFVSTVACLGGLIVVHRLTAHELGEPVANAAIRYLLIFPTAFFFFAVYTESLFLLVTAAACFFAIRRQWWLAGACGFLAALARPPGILIGLPLAIEYLLWLRRERRWPGLELASLALVPAGLGSYMLYLGQRFGNPLEFSHAQRNHIWGHEYKSPLETLDLIGRSVDLSTEALLAPQRITEGIRVDLYLGGFRDANGYNLLFFLFGLVVAILAFRLLRPSLAAYALVMMVFPTIAPEPLTPLQSIPRYMLPVFPLFMALAIMGLKDARLDRVLSYTAVPLLGIFTVRFVTWYWVA